MTHELVSPGLDEAHACVPVEPRKDPELHLIDGDAILFDPATGHTHRLNETALEIWRRSGEGFTPHQIAAALTARYETTYESAFGHVESTLRVLEEHQLISGRHERASCEHLEAART